MSEPGATDITLAELSPACDCARDQRLGSRRHKEADQPRADSDAA